MIHNSSQRAANLALVLLLSILALTHVSSGSAQVGETASTTIKNFGKVNETYYRGSQPNALEIEQLKRIGIKTVIDLRKDFKPEERGWVTKTGMQYFNIPLKASRAATETETTYFMTLVNDPKNWPVYVHCKGGKHRTGALTGVYRITHDGWTAAQAFEEMKKYRFEDGFFGGPADQKKFVFSFYERYVSSHHKK